MGNADRTERLWTMSTTQQIASARESNIVITGLDDSCPMRGMTEIHCSGFSCSSSGKDVLSRTILCNPASSHSGTILVSSLSALATSYGIRFVSSAAIAIPDWPRLPELIMRRLPTYRLFVIVNLTIESCRPCEWTLPSKRKSCYVIHDQSGTSRSLMRSWPPMPRQWFQTYSL